MTTARSTATWSALRRLTLASLALAGPALAQDGVFEKVALRVAAVRPNGEVTIDRGVRDLVRAGDKVVLLPRDGGVIHGTVTAVEARTAIVELLDHNATVLPGVRGEVLVPRARRAAQRVTPAETPTPVPDEPPGDVPAGESPSATDEPRRAPNDDGWRTGMPLLAGSRPLRPSERAARITGRAYTTADLTHTLDTFTHSFARLGTDFEVENPSGHGGTLRVHTELSYLTETNQQTGADLRFYEVSYAHGGTRYEPMRWQVGRFLQNDMPEFGILDGGEWGYRLEDGQRFGASFGFLPELDEDMTTGKDLQLAAWWLWPDTIAERLTVGLGYQKTWHNLSPDRDLVVAKVRYLPLDGWDLAATTWVDVYYGGDQKGDGIGLTRARAHASRRWDDGSGLEFVYDHEEYVDQRRQELPQRIAPATLLDAHQDRLQMHAYLETDGGSRWFTRVTGWSDEENTGGTAELGVLADDLLLKGARSGVAGFLVQGPSSSLLGARIDHGGKLAGGRLDAIAEVALVHHDGFPSDSDDLIQYRLAGYWSTDVGSNWYLITYGDGTLWDKEFSFAAGLYLQRTF
ncbi:MAG: hypothetical protein KDE27_04510 [Planctomycetes bacterium]|nr:hypothetical protein [Planctomycetota bacterium]